MISETYVNKISIITDVPDSTVRKVLYGVIISMCADSIKDKSITETPFGVVTSKDNVTMTVKLSDDIVNFDPQTIFNAMSKRI